MKWVSHVFLFASLVTLSGCSLFSKKDMSAESSSKANTQSESKSTADQGVDSSFEKLLEKEANMEEEWWSEDDLQLLDAEEYAEARAEVVDDWAMFTASYSQVLRDCNVRSKPNTQGRILGRLSKGGRVLVNEHNSRWVKLQHKTKEAFVSKYCLGATSDSSSTKTSKR